LKWAHARGSLGLLVLLSQDHSTRWRFPQRRGAPAPCICPNG